ncbi:hypothetical protein [Marinobacter sp. SS21]|uniref:hypothetical protein n=1 Tax=Marinobacter sp. SS21 TaxID=2979460 RepID=UPI00232EECED|nr:hypothetical protein [Marinobacter sp. SS21]MDC0661001.1 hypothetical protein [Marinobacter sp. SS21]
MTTTTANAMTDHTPSQSSPEQLRRGRRMAWLLFAVGFGPMLLATAMYYTGWLNPAGHTNQGELLQPPVAVTELALVGADGQPLAQRFAPQAAEAKWLLLVVADGCAGSCEQLLYLARQVNIALGKNANRVAGAAWVGQLPNALAQRWPDDYRTIERLTVLPEAVPAWPEQLAPAEAPSLLLVDPLGNVMMRYDSSHRGEAMLKDLKHLLKLSQIG